MGKAAVLTEVTISECIQHIQWKHTDGSWCEIQSIIRFFLCALKSSLANLNARSREVVRAATSSLNIILLHDLEGWLCQDCEHTSHDYSHFHQGLQLVFSFALDNFSHEILPATLWSYFYPPKRCLIHVYCLSSDPAHSFMNFLDIWLWELMFFFCVLCPVSISTSCSVMTGFWKAMSSSCAVKTRNWMFVSLFC